MDQELKQAISHVLWIGGGTDSGKTTISRIIAERYGFQIYNYDQHDLPQMECLAQAMPHYRLFLSETLDERWVRPEPEDILQRTLQAFQDRFPLVVEELLGMPKDPMIVAEGFGFTPELLSPLLPSSRQAIWLVPTEEFKRASMERRNKPSFKDKVSDPERATRNLFLRDMLLAKQVKLQAQSFGMTVYEIDGALPVEQIAALVEQHFKPLFYEASEPGKCNDIA